MSDCAICVASKHFFVLNTILTCLIIFFLLFTISREATRRWHIKYEHRDDKENEEDSDDEHLEEASAENDGDFKIDIKKEQTETIHFTLDDDKTAQEIHVIIEQPENVDKLEGADEQNKAFSSLPCKQPVVRFREAKDRELDRPYPCEICGRRFKEVFNLCHF